MLLSFFTLSSQTIVHMSRAHKKTTTEKRSEWKAINLELEEKMEKPLQDSREKTTISKGKQYMRTRKKATKKHCVLLLNFIDFV